VWEASYITPDKYQSLEARFKEISNRAIRNSNDNIIRSIELDVIIAKSESELEYKKKLFIMDRGPGVFNQIMRNGLVGTPDRIGEKIKDYVKVGVEQFFLAFHDPFNHNDLELLMDSVK
jgi:alkanesulfonate monooxygenase SsuD/methylene tetrahydromethanopterin reductase-like flavin-dependent oxidoreductase (luciferase family)